MLGYIPRCIFCPQGDITASQALGKATGRLLLWLGFKPSLFSGPKNQPFPCCCVTRRGRRQPGGFFSECLATQVSKILPLPSPCSARGCSLPLPAPEQGSTSFPCASPQNLHLLLPGSITTQRAEPAGHSKRGGSHGRPRGKAHTELSWHKAPLQQHSSSRAASSSLGHTSCPGKAQPASKSPHPTGRAAFEAHNSRRCSPSGSCGCHTCKRTPCRRRRGSGST